MDAFTETALPDGWHQLRARTFYEQALQAVRKTCGRTTTRGLPCRATLQWYQAACTDHATEAERAQALEALRRRP